MKALDILTNLALAHKKQVHPNIPEAYIPRPKFEDKTANGLTKCIATYIRLQGGFISRINSQGQYDGKLGMWRPGTTTKGISDLIGCVPALRGKLLAIEVKIGPDKQSDDQILFEAQVTQAGAFYVVAKSFQGFYDWFTSLKPD